MFLIPTKKYAVSGWAKDRSSTLYAELPRFSCHAGINEFLINQVKLQLYASGWILTSDFTDLINLTSKL